MTRSDRFAFIAFLLITALTALLITVILTKGFTS